MTILHTFNNNITCGSGLQLKPLSKNPEYYFESTTLIFGRRNSGKTTIINEILYLCKNLIPLCFVISTTNSSNNNFTNIIPDKCIFSELNEKWLIEIWNRQKDVSEIYNIVNDVNNLYSLFKLIANNQEIEFFNKHNKLFIKFHKKINSLKNDNNKHKYLDEINKTKRIFTIKFLKNVIKKNIAKIDYKKLLPIQKITIKFIDFNPGILIVFDDCASLFKKWAKKNDIIKRIFYEGRHYHITIIVSSQDDKEIESEYRKNTIVTIFTTEEAAIANFERKSNSFSKSKINMAQEVIKELFQSKISHAKLVYLANDDSSFRYTIADIPPPFKMCSSILWNYVTRVKKDEQKNKKTNRFIESIK